MYSLLVPVIFGVKWLPLCSTSRYKNSKNFKTFLFLFSNKLLVIGLELRLANREDPEQTVSSEGSGSALSKPSALQAVGVQNSRTSTAH